MQPSTLKRKACAYLSIELNYMITVSLFPFISIEHKFKVYESAGVARIYITAILLKFLSMSVWLLNHELFRFFLPDEFLEAYIDCSMFYIVIEIVHDMMIDMVEYVLHAQTAIV